MDKYSSFQTRSLPWSTKTICAKRFFLRGKPQPELVDACVYEINAELSRYDYLLRQIKERGGRAVCKTCSEGAVKWE